ncbi:3-keto-disaccharide hydrolase [Pareuzebyella sediminis]|uniref:3-keto-disaccharide hydrolase n=1 Tax=Pareuzebyella sediminis TaxID=2607998 RepID=UPI0011ED088D|nr:DUF1080 domain-containing protein [Pareuzebyella sediminis]
MKNFIGIALIVFMTLGCKEKTKDKEGQIETEPNAQMENSTEDEWEVLFDGSSFEGWKGYLKEGVPSHWKIEDGAMVFYPPEERKEGEIFDLVSEREFTDFILSLDWKISEAGNSGVFWGINEALELKKPYHTGPEIQVLDNEKHPDAKNGTTHQAGSLYDMVAPSKDVTNDVGEWNTMIITVDHQKKQGSVELNGVDIVSFPLANEAWNEMVSESKFADWEEFGKYSTGKIGLQDHGNRVSFRDIKIKELNN